MCVRVLLCSQNYCYLAPIANKNVFYQTGPRSSHVFDRCTGLIINNNNITKHISANNLYNPNMLLVIR